MFVKEKQPEALKKALNAAIDFAVSNRNIFVQNPQKDFTRNRKLSMRDVIELILSMEGGSLHREMFNYAQLTGKTLSASAFVQQRSKILSSAFQAIFQAFNNEWNDSHTFRGYHLLAVDGSDINQYRDPKADTFVSRSDYPYGYNQTHLNALYDLCNKIYVDAELQPRPVENEHEALITMLRRGNYPHNSLILADRGYESYNTFAHMYEMNLDFLFRIKDGAGAMTKVKELPMKDCDCDITFEITTTQTNEDKKKGRLFIQTRSKKGKQHSPKTKLRQWDFPSPYTMTLRIVRFMLDTGEYETVATSLPRDEFPAKEIKELYHMRWGIETSFRELKYNIGLANMHCKKDDLVKQEIYAALTMYNFCSRVSNMVDIPVKETRKHRYKLNFTMGVYLCKQYYKTSSMPGYVILQELKHYMEPIRPGRKDSRKMKTKRFVGFSYRVVHTAVVNGHWCGAERPSCVA